MIDVARCPQCGATKPEHEAQCRETDLAQRSQSVTLLARTLNGTPWRERVRWTPRAIANFAPAD
jgi:hypothetical protein